MMYNKHSPVYSLLELYSSMMAGKNTPKPWLIPMISAWETVAQTQTSTDQQLSCLRGFA